MKRNYAVPPAFAPSPSPWPDLGGGPLAIVLPCVDVRLSPEQALSLATLRRWAPAVPRFLVVPEGLTPGWAHDDFRLLPIPAAAMASVADYNRMMLTPWFYRLFAGFDAILIFQTDCLLLRDDLAAWAARGWSYVGAPWFSSKRGQRLKGVGNGGFSLRRPADALAVLESGAFSLWPRYGQQLRRFASFKHGGMLARTLAAARRNATAEPLATRFVRHFQRPEDEFWSDYAPFFHQAYRLPPPLAALDFAFEPRPADCLALNGGRLPLGCHAWAKMDRGFWLDRLAERDPSLLEVLHSD